MLYKSAFIVRAPLERVVDYHIRPKGLGELTPPPAIVRLHSAPEVIGERDEMRFTIWFGPLPVPWKARFEQVYLGGKEQAFTDRMVAGPFREWVHTHRFHKIASGVTEIRDEIHLRFRLHPYYGLVGILFWLGLPIMFRYRARKTRRIIESTSAVEASQSNASG